MKALRDKSTAGLLTCTPATAAQATSAQQSATLGVTQKGLPQELVSLHKRSPSIKTVGRADGMTELTITGGKDLGRALSSPRGSGQFFLSVSKGRRLFFFVLPKNPTDCVFLEQ